MPQPLFYPSYPKRILWRGLTILMSSLGLGVLFLIFWCHSPPLAIDCSPSRIEEKAKEPISFSLRCKELPVTFPILQVPKMRAEELFHAIRIRSDRQISCIMDKQCLILRCGDWVLKSNGRWRVLKKKEEKDSYKSGKISGELFAFEKIESRQEQKFIVGSFFNSEKSQPIPVDLAVRKHPSRKETNR